LRPCLAVFRPRGFSLILGIIPRLKIALLAFDFLVAAEAQVVPAFFCRRGRAVAMHHLRVQQTGLMERGYRASEKGIDAAVLLPIPEHPVNPRVVDFRKPLLACLDRPFFPLTTQIQQLQDVIEDRM
jgi:hypothetical protein